MAKHSAKPSGREFAPHVIDRLTVTERRALIFSANAEAQRWFARVFAADIRSVISELTGAFNSYKDLSDKLVLEGRTGTVMLFVHTSIHSVLSSIHLFVSGFPVPAGHLMRQHAETLAMAMMCADAEIDVYDRYHANRRQYPVHKALDLVTQAKISKSLQKNLQLNKQGYEGFAKVMRFYDQLSHASAVTMAYSIMHTRSGGLVIGSQHDPAKRRAYKAELRRYSQACKIIRRLVEILQDVLPARTAPGPKAAV